jgi:hypothetical protein
MTVLLPFRRYLLGAAWCRNLLWKKARAVPSLDLDFAGTKSLNDGISSRNLITFTRASTGTFVGSDRLLKTATTNEARFDHNPTTGESLGLLVEEARTNSIRNNTMVGAVAGTPGTLPTNWSMFTTITGISREIVGTGTENGITYIDLRISGTATANVAITIASEPNNSTAALNGQSWTYSAYVKLVAGSFSGFNSPQIIVEEYSAAAAFLAGQTTNVPAPTTTLTRLSATRTNTNALTAFEYAGIRHYVNNGNTVDITLRIGLPQLEQGAFATSPILTSTATATRAADVASITGSNFSSWYNQTEGTVFAETQLQSIAARTVAGFDINDNSTNNRIIFRALTSSIADQTVIRSASSTVFSAANVSPAPTTASRKSAVGYKVNDFVFTAIGSAGYTGTTGAVPVSVNQMLIGYEQGPTGQLGGTIKRLVYWGQRLPNNVLQAITQ